MVSQVPSRKPSALQEQKITSSSVAAVRIVVNLYGCIVGGVLNKNGRRFRRLCLVWLVRFEMLRLSGCRGGFQGFIYR